MNIGRVIGNVWATRKTPTLDGRRMLFVQPMNFKGLDLGDPIIALDTVDAGRGDTVMYVSSSEATVPFKPDLVPTDATIVGVIDRVDHNSGSWTPARH